jgi:hypothetical protein
MWDRNSLARSVLGPPAGPGAGAHPWADGGRVFQSPSRGDDSRTTCQSRIDDRFVELGHERPDTTSGMLWAACWRANRLVRSKLRQLAVSFRI